MGLAYLLIAGLAALSPCRAQDADAAGAPAGEAAEGAVEDTSDGALPEVKVLTSDDQPAEGEPATKKTAKAPSPQRKSPRNVAPKPVAGTPEEVDGTPAGSPDGADASFESGEAPPGAPGTGTTGIDGYVARGTSTATKTNTPIKNIPQSISVVTKQQAEDRGSESLGEALAYVPGVSVAQGEGHRDQITIRGQVTTADFFVDGVRDDIEYYRDLYNVETIEVLKGPAAMVFGRGGGGGVVNRVTKKADGERVREVTANGGMFERKRTTIDVGDKLTSSAAFRLNAMYEDSESFRDFFELERYAINPELGLRLTDQTRIALSYEYYKDDRTVDRGVPSLNGRPSGGPIETFFGNPAVSFSDFAGHTATATIEHKTDLGLSVRNHTSYSHADKLYQNIFATSAVDPVTLTLNLGGYQDGTARETIINQTDATYRLDLGGGIRHTLAFGTELSRQVTDNFRNEPRFFDPVAGASTIAVPFASPTNSAPVFFSNPTRRRHTELDVIGGYVQDQLEISKYLEVIGGMRFDRFDIAFRNELTNDELERRDDVWSPRIGAVVKPVETLSLYVSASESFLPGAGDQFNNLSTVDGRTLRPEVFRNKEIGFKWEVAPRLFFTGALFRLDRENELVSDGPFSGQQVGLTRTDGGELALTGYVTNDWQVSAGWGHQVSEVVDGNPDVIGHEKPFVPNDIFSLWNRYQFLPWVGAGVGVIHQSESFAALDNEVELPSFTRVDAALFLDFNENWSAQVNVENVFDEEYFASAHNNNNISPGAPRSAYVTVKASF